MRELRCVIVDDEPPARRRLRDLLAREDDLQLVGEAGNGPDAVTLINAERPDLVFLDVQMPGADGFEVLASLDTPPGAVIFVTAFDAYALRAFEVHALDYLLKPFDRERFGTALERVRQMLARPATTDDPRLVALLQELATRDSHLRRVAVRTAGRIRLVQLDDVECVEAAGNYLRLHVAGGHHLIRETITSFEERLDPERFTRIHRSMIVNVDRIRELVPTPHGDCTVTLASGRRIVASRTYRSRLRGRLGPDC